VSVVQGLSHFRAIGASVKEEADGPFPFTATTGQPSDTVGTDSGQEHEAMTATVKRTTTKAAKVTKGKPCLCGCGGMTKGGTWLPGHDATLRAEILRDFDFHAWFAGDLVYIGRAGQPVATLRPEDV
jgi:hypothetical protein